MSLGGGKGARNNKEDRQTDHEHAALRAHVSPKFAFLLPCSLTFPSRTSPFFFLSAGRTDRRLPAAKIIKEKWGQTGELALVAVLLGAEDGTSWFVAAAIGGCGYFQLMGKVGWQILGENERGDSVPFGAGRGQDCWK